LQDDYINGEKSFIGTIILAEYYSMKKFLILLFSICQLQIADCQAPQSWTSADMYLAIRKLNVLGTVLYVAAHPDDENTRLITYFSKDRLYRTGYLSITRGDGGQNLIGDEQGIELGLIRTQELLAARRIDGGEQFFTRGYDFGYSKTASETFTKWNKEKILGDVVWIIRQFRPDVIITRFPITGEGGHGHHTASAILAVEAFNAAADPNRFPEQGAQPWQAKRVVWNAFNFGNTTPPADLLKLDVGGYSPLLGKSYGEIAAESRSQHKSQGFGVAASRGESFESFRTLAGTEPSSDLMDGVDQGWKRVTGAEAIPGIIDSLSASFDLTHPEKSVKGLVRLYNTINNLTESYWRTQKLKEVKQLIEQCSGLFIEATSPDQYAVQTDSMRVNFSLNNRLGVNSTILRIGMVNMDTSLNQALVKNKNLNFSRTLFVSEEKSITQPYWLRSKMEEGYYNIPYQSLVGRADVEPAFYAGFYLNIEGTEFEFIKPVKNKSTDPVRGELYQPIAVLPKILVTADQPLMLSINKNDFQGNLVAMARTRKLPVYINYITTLEPIGVKPTNLTSGFTIDERNKEYPVNYSIKSNVSEEYRFAYNDGTSPGHILPVYRPNYDPIKDYQHPAYSLREIKYDHIPQINYFIPTAVKNVKIDLKIDNKKIGYIIGAGDKVPEALEQMGYEVTLLSDKELSRNNLSQFDAIITGVRAYNTNEWMNKHYDKLMKYVNDGGNLIVQYNTSTNIGPVRAKISPYNFTISRTRITDENAPVSFIRPNHAVLNFPNKITQDDFKGWIQERSIYHAAAWDSARFEPILAFTDPGEKPEDGSLIIAKYGKGYFTYTGIVFFRELPAGVPGAYRLLANIIALNKKKAF
jgi:LmbE family N-acetylglucosaminyl deacetylase